jgi:hypothetical protein
MKKSALQRSSEISEEEKQAAKDAIKAFDTFVKKLNGIRKHDKRLVDLLEQDEILESKSLYDIRHLLRRFQKEVKQRYAEVIVDFAGQRTGGNDISEGYIHTLNLLKRDTITNNIKIALQDAFQTLTEFAEEFIDSFENFHDKDQIKQIVNSSSKIEQIVQTIENIIDTQLKPHFEKNILIKNKFANNLSSISRRKRMLKILVG